jgi:hypothetical protein
MASAAQCEQALDRYIDLQLSEDVAARAMTDLDRAHRRGSVKEQCEAEVTEAAYQCAAKAPTAAAWNACIR